VGLLLWFCVGGWVEERERGRERTIISDAHCPAYEPQSAHECVPKVLLMCS
jgi:hypothetical protein